MLTKGSSARIHVTLRNSATGSARKAEIPLETFATNKSMGRVLFRRGGTTIGSLLVCFSFAELSRADPRTRAFAPFAAAGIVLELLP